jgi:transglutaminase-like putative cysteine protease
LSILNVRHTTVYRYRRPVALGDHRLMLRPRDSHDLRLIQTNLNLSPPATLRWSHDVFGNSIAIASFAEPSAELRIESSLQLETGLPDHSGGSELSVRFDEHVATNFA